ncbi:MAG: membrane protein [Herpetosiphonaceae bacterium]|nr:MAG: membrane protein [Herpetosiphonaceae bacterium]
MSYNVPSLTAAQIRHRTLFTQIYAWMGGGLALTGVIALWAYSSNLIVDLITSGMFFGLIVGEIILVLALSWGINRMSIGVATGAFLLYAALNGLTMAVIFLAYTASSIGVTFLVTAGTFAAMSIYGYTTKRDLSTTGSLLIMALFGLILGTIANLFLRSEVLYWVITYAGVLIFTGLVAYDTQKIKLLSDQMAGSEETPQFRRAVILGALKLYLDFINLFLFLLRILGKRR